MYKQAVPMAALCAVLLSARAGSAAEKEPIAGVRMATVVVAAADAPEHVKKGADVVCPG